MGIIRVETTPRLLDDLNDVRGNLIRNYLETDHQIAFKKIRSIVSYTDSHGFNETINSSIVQIDLLPKKINVLQGDKSGGDALGFLRFKRENSDSW